jgi:hypothetical protein
MWKLPCIQEERKKEILSTGLSASAMGPRAVAGGECTKMNHQESHLQRHVLPQHRGYTPNHLLTVSWQHHHMTCETNRRRHAWHCIITSGCRIRTDPFPYTQHSPSTQHCQWAQVPEHAQGQVHAQTPGPPPTPVQWQAPWLATTANSRAAQAATRKERTQESTTAASVIAPVVVSQQAQQHSIQRIIKHQLTKRTRGDAVQLSASKYM